MKVATSHLLRFSVLLLFVSLITSLYWFLYNKPQGGIDDADIYFTYVRNFVNGHGFVYYRNGKEKPGTYPDLPGVTGLGVNPR